MSRVIFFDAGPLGIITNPRLPSLALTISAIQWAIQLTHAGHRLIVPAVADFEVRRELLCAGKTQGIELLNACNMAQPDRYLPLTDSALKRAAELWSQAGNRGALPADPKELSCDVLIASQALDYQELFGLSTSDIIIATLNVGHISLFAPADIWTNITV